MIKKNTAILLFDDVEVLDFAGPFEVFSSTNELNANALLSIYTVAPHKTLITAKNGLSVMPDYGFDDAPVADLLIIPGGEGIRSIMTKPDVITWVRKQAQSALKVMSVCTGALLLAKAKLLDGIGATTHHLFYGMLKDMAPNTHVFEGKRFIDNGAVITAAGVTAGIDMSLHVVAELYGEDQARETAAYIEYEQAAKEAAVQEN